MAAKIPISSGDETPQYKLVQQLAPELRVAVQHDLCAVSELLLKHGMITEESHEEFTDSRVAVSHVRASSLIRTVLSRIKVDTRYFETFVKVLEEKELYYEAVLEKLRVDLVVDEQPIAPQNFSHNLEESDDEASVLLQVRIEDGPRTNLPQHRRSASGSEVCCVACVLCCFLIICIVMLLVLFGSPLYVLLFRGNSLKCYRITFISINILKLLPVSVCLTEISDPVTKIILFAVLIILTDLLCNCVVHHFCL